MRKIIGAINMTLDGVFDHTAADPDEEVHQHYAELLNNADDILYGRITFGLMGYWKTLLQEPSAEKTMNDFATAIDRINKIVFSHTLKDPEWKSARLANGNLEQEISALTQMPGGDILVGSRSLIIQLINLNLLSELQLCIHPVLAGKGLPLFDQIGQRTLLKLSNTKTFDSGAVILYYQCGKTMNK